MSESLHAGNLPLWNPYINFGIPQYGDMSSGFWSPLTWLIAATVGYNAYTFTIELLSYILIGGMGMYVLLKYFNIQNKIRFIAAVAYMCCGYNVGHLQHFNWLGGAAFLPWCIFAYLNLVRTFSLKNVLLAVIAFYLFASSAHPGLIISGIYFFTALAIFTFFKKENVVQAPAKIKRFFAINAILLTGVILLSAGMIIGYTDILPYFSRGEKVALTAALKSPTSIQSWISVLLPLSTTKNDAFFGTDISMRNIYFSLTFFLFFLIALFKKKNGWQLFFLSIGLFFLLLSSGGIFKTFAYNFLPFIGYVRLDGEFAIFAILSFIIIAAIQLNKFIKEEEAFKGTAKHLYYLLEFILFASIVFGLYKTISLKSGVLYSLGDVFAQTGFSQKLKTLIDSLSFYDTLWLQGLIQLLILWLIKFCLREKKWTGLVKVVIAEVIIATLLNLPFTGVGQASVADVQNVLNKSPKGIPIPALQPIIKNDSLISAEKDLVGNWSFYNKQIGVTLQAFYPIALSSTNKYFSATPDTSLNIMQRNYLFLKNDKENKQSSIQSFTGNKIQIKIFAHQDDTLVFLQANYPHWFYKSGENKNATLPYAATFISAPVKKGDNNIEFVFEPVKVKVGMLISLITFCMIIILLILNPAFIRRSLYPS